MKTIRISDEVWDAIAARGKFGETEDVVLRRVLNVGGSSQAVGTPGSSNGKASDGGARPHAWKQRRATDRMTQTVVDGKLILQFDSGPKQEWTLPAREDGLAIRRVRDEAVAFVRENGGTTGQEHAAIRALTHRGYHVTVRREYV